MWGDSAQHPSDVRGEGTAGGVGEGEELSDLY